MTIKALVATLVLGSSSIALAAPGAPVVRDHRTHTVRYQQPVTIAPQPVTWVTLASDQRVFGRTVIEVAPSARPFTKLSLRAEDGRTRIQTVTIVFGNGAKQTVTLDTRLSRATPSVQIDLAGNTRRIDQIIVTGRSNGRHTGFDVLAI